MISGIPEGVVDVPAAVAVLAGGRDLRPVWLNELGGLTFAIDGQDGGAESFVKFAPAGSGLPLAREAGRLRWAAGHTPVPRVLATGADETGVWLHTVALPGRMAVHPRWKADPARAVAAIGHGLRALHDRVPAGDCPFSWSVADRLAVIRPDLIGAHPDHAHLTYAEAVAIARRPPPVDRLVVCHGDACAPNTLLDDDGAWTGHVDLAALGVADRWADLAVASWSLHWNFGDEWEPAFFAAYGIDPDPERIAYYRLLWELGP
jgi:kanamycin kinase